MKFSTSLVLLLSTVQSIQAQFEWAGTFALNADLEDPAYRWIMQQVDGSYADPSMRLVIFSTDDTSMEVIESNESAANTMLSATDCTVVEAGGTISNIAPEGSCYELQVGNDADSFYPMNTNGLASILVFAEHVPIEFERDMHYFQEVITLADVEPVAQEGGDGHDHSHAHDHGDKPSCACVAAEYGFSIDCTATAAMLDSLSILKATGCSTDCSSDTCQEAWYIVQIHHDYCDPRVVPPNVNTDFHDFDEVCTSCDINRRFVEGASACPTPNCDDASGNEAYVFLVENSCSTGCSANTDCVEKYETLRSVHDQCDRDVLSTAAEKGLHDFEEFCFDVICNAPGSEEDQLTCTEQSAGAARRAMTLAAGAVLLGASCIAV